MKLDSARCRRLIHDSDFRKLFREELGWDKLDTPLSVDVGGQSYSLQAVAEKRGMAVFVCGPAADGQVLDYPTRLRVERRVARSVHEHLIVFADKAQSTQVWQWVRREPGKPLATREHTYTRGQTGDPLIGRLEQLAVTLDEEESIGLIDVTTKTKAAFDVEKVTKRFYERFKAEHTAFLGFVAGIQAQADREWYASLMLNRLMFVYFIQKKGFLDGDPDYLRNRLALVRGQRGKGQFLTFYRHFLLRLFHEGLGKEPGQRPAGLDALLGKVPYLNGGLFDVHELERTYPKIDVPDEAFERIFAFFDAYQWRLDERPLRADDEINPDVLGYIFEKYINQKQMGAYYTKEDITEYIAKSTIVPFLLEKARDNCLIAFEGEQSVWRLLRDDPDRYIYPAVKKGTEIPLAESIAAGISDVSKRGGWNKPADSVYALPTETWREHVARRQRCEALRADLSAGRIASTDQLVTLNLDVRQFAQDAIESAEGSDLLRAFWKAIGEVTVLDPTCGSGAFLFAALNVLEPLYEASLERMESFVEDANRSARKGQTARFPDFRRVLDDVARHPNRRYFILKSIVVKNLYGVDIMEEAVEIAKLRLFLKLVAQVESADQIEPLPDVDFNVRAGNTLVGFTSMDDVRRALTVASGGNYKMQFGEDEEIAARILERAKGVERDFENFQKRQLALDHSAQAGYKVTLEKSLRELADELDRYLATEYGVPQTAEAFARWRASHQPFHWLAEFYGIMSRGGFDVIIGNPPYVELDELKHYTIRGYRCIDSGNLYAVVLERCFDLCSYRGYQGFIVPVSSVSTDRYSSLQRLVEQRLLHYSSYDDRPSRLFEGLEHIRLTIHIISPGDQTPALLSTKYNKWSSCERVTLFERLQYAQASNGLMLGSLPKLSDPIENRVTARLAAQKARLVGFITNNGPHRVYYSRKVGYFLQVLDFQPTVLDGHGTLRPPSEFKSLDFSSSGEAEAALCCLNSSLFYWFVTAVSDCRHVNKREVDNFPIDLAKVSCGETGRRLSELGPQLMQDLKRNSVDKRMVFRHDTLTVQCIFPKASKPIIDEIDRVLAQHYGFTDEELDFIINYDIKYRMGQDSSGED